MSSATHHASRGPGPAPLLPGPDPDTRAPRQRFPALACDCHAHVFGDEARFAYTPDAAYRFPAVGLDDYERMLDTIGCARGVLVQPSVYGNDNRCMLEALRSRPASLRGVAVVRPDIGAAELQVLHDAGVRGIRINVSSKTAGLKLEHAPQLAARIAPLGWHLQFFARAAQLLELPARLATLPVPCVIDHFGNVPARDGTRSPGFMALLELARLEHVWFKLMGAYRISSRTPHFEDAVPLARALIAAAPQRCVWATDWPHPNAVPVPNDGALADQLEQWAPDAATRRRILVDNPARLYGFDEGAGDGAHDYPAQAR